MDPRLLEDWLAGESVGALATRHGVDPAVVEAELERRLEELSARVRGGQVA